MHATAALLAALVRIAVLSWPYRFECGVVGVRAAKTMLTVTRRRRRSTSGLTREPNLQSSVGSTCSLQWSLWGYRATRSLNAAGTARTGAAAEVVRCSVGWYRRVIAVEGALLCYA